MCCIVLFVFFKQKTSYELRISDWSSDVCSSDLLLISQFRAQALGERFSMFDFTPVGLAIALAGVAFIVTIGWRLIPKDRQGKAAEQESFEVTDYSTEMRSEERRVGNECVST